jgi:hypothetical protein
MEHNGLQRIIKEISSKSMAFEEWQEIECPRCRIDWDLDQTLLYKGHTIECINGCEPFTISEETCRTFRIDEDGEVRSLPLPINWIEKPFAILPEQEEHG